MSGRDHLDVAFVVTSLHGGGAEAVGRTWMAWLAGRGHRTTAITTSRKDTGALLPAGVGSETLGGVTGHVGKALELRRVLRRTRPDVVLSMQAYPNLLTLAATALMRARERPRTVVSERNLVSPGLVGAPLSHRVKHRLLDVLYPRADRVLAISHPVAAELVSSNRGTRGAAQRCVVIPNPALPDTAERPRTTRRDGEPGVLDVVIAHRLVPQKQPWLALDVATELRGRRRTRLTVFGDGPLRPELEAAARSRDVEIDLRGWVEDWPARCAPGSVHLLTSSREGFGNVLVEAAAAGIPSVALSGALGVADAVVPGLSGVLARDDSPAALADAVERAAGLPMPPAVLEPWLERFTRSSSGAALERLLRSTCTDDPRRATP